MNVSRTFPSDSSSYWLESNFEIRQVLRTLAKRAEKITVYAASGEAFVTMILDVADRGSVVIDASTDAKINALATSDSDVFVHGVLDKVDIDFKFAKARLIDYKGAPALIFSVPGRLHKLQRREYFRVPTPMMRPLMCSIYLEGQEDGQDKLSEFQASVLDLSVGGMCLQEPAGLRLVPGRIYKNCSMFLPESGVFRFDLTVRHTFDVENRLGKAKRRAGCEFVNLHPANQQTVQKFMAKLERARRAVL